MDKINEIVKMKLELEQKLNVKLDIAGHFVNYSGSAFDEYEAGRVFEAIGFGFSVKKALLLKLEDMEFKVIHVKKYTKRNLRVVLSRVIGLQGKTRRILEDISGCEILITDSDVGVIGYAEVVEDVVNAVISLIRGTKQANIYRYLERMNRVKKEAANLDIRSH